MRVQAEDARCSGCKLCQLTCSLQLFGVNNLKKTAIKVWSQHFTKGYYHVAVCDQCGICAEVCPTDAIVLQDGVYRIEEEYCIDCRLCVEACPSGTMFVHRELPVPIKCVACGECVRLCPTHALAMSQ